MFVADARDGLATHSSGSSSLSQTLFFFAGCQKPPSRQRPSFFIRGWEEASLPSGRIREAKGTGTPRQGGAILQTHKPQGAFSPTRILQEPEKGLGAGWISWLVTTLL